MVAGPAAAKEKSLHRAKQGWAVEWKAYNAGTFSGSGDTGRSLQVSAGMLTQEAGRYSRSSPRSSRQGGRESKW